MSALTTTRRALLLSIIGFAAAGPAGAAPCVNPGGTGGCVASVQAAVSAATAGDVIAIAAGTYTEVVVVDRSVTLQGADQATTILDGGAAGSVVSTTAGLTVVLADLTIQNGNASAGPNAGRGGGIFGAGNLTLTNVTVQNNTAASSGGEGGGGIFFDDAAGRLTLTGCTVTGNSGVFGGGIHVGCGRARIADSTISGNFKGGISDINHGGCARMEILASTVSGNSGTWAGIDASGRWKITSSTISNNTSTFCTAGINVSGIGRVKITSSTIADNTATFNCSGAGVGLNAEGKAKIRASIVASNTNASGDRDCGGEVRSRGYNLIEDPVNCTLVGKATGNIFGVDPNLGPLENNGGPTDTRALLPGSPAIDAVNRCPKTDQRGTPRGRPCDMGAYEL